MSVPDRRRMRVNRAKWDESVPLHFASPSYDVASFRRGRETLTSLEIEEAGDVDGRTLLHLQCHFGMDTLSWARHGAIVTGVDFSAPAVATARRLASEIGIPARFLRANVYDLPSRLGGRFDVVYTGRGAIGWLPDIDRWAGVVSHFLAPGGRFLMLEDHPFSDIYRNDGPVRTLQYDVPYFDDRPQRWVTDGTYATSQMMRHKVSYGWNHRVSNVLNALADAGLRIERVREFPFTYWKKFPFMRKGPDGFWHLRKQEGLLPLAWTVRASKEKSTRVRRTPRRSARRARGSPSRA